jgi:hypothetical protein
MATKTALSAKAGMLANFVGAQAVTPSDTVDLANAARGLWVTAGGNVVFDTVGGDTVTLSAVSANSLLPFMVARVRTGTTATVLACY